MNRYALLAFVASMLIASKQSSAEIFAYPSPGNVDESPHFEVSISNSRESQDCFVHISKAQWRTNISEDTSYTSFSADEPVTVTVTNLIGDFKDARVLPSSRNIQVTRSENQISFVVDKPGKFAVEFDESIIHPLLVFADAPETDRPSRDDPNVHYFSKGVHFLGIPGLYLKPGKHVYLEPGAFVKGRIFADEASGSRIYGRGILSGKHLPGQPPGEYSVPHMIHFTGECQDVSVEGITIVGSPHYNVVASGNNARVENVKMISWWWGTDGAVVGPGGHIKNCFMKVNDDAVKLYNSGMLVEDCTFWQMDNGGIFQLSWNLRGDRSGFVVRNCDIIRVEHQKEANNRGIIVSIHGGDANLSDYTFEDIRIENANWRFLLLTCKKTYWAKSKTVGNISNLTFRNISIDGEFQHASKVISYEDEASINWLEFEKLTINGEVVNSAEKLNLEYDPTKTDKLEFR